jgi:hypothetical protein
MSSNRIRYVKHKYKPGHVVSGRSFTSKSTGAKYRIVLRNEDKDDMQFFIRNERTKEYVYKSRIHTNLNVLKREARSRLEEFGVELKKEIRDRTFGLCEVGKTQKEHEMLENSEDKDEL